MLLNVIKKGFNFSQDGPGNRLVYHLQGCNMHCPWCANPESWKQEGTLLQSENIGIHSSFTPQKVEDLLEEAADSRPLFFEGGGITLTGGEPTLQFEALREFLTGLKADGIHTAIETNATHPRLRELFPLLDLLIMDCKHIDDEVHREVTGVTNRTILQNVKTAMAEHGNVLIRTPLINGFNANIPAAKQFLDFYRQCDTSSTRFELLKYHEYGRAKWTACGMPYQVDAGFITDSLYTEIENIYIRGGLSVVRT